MPREVSAKTMVLEGPSIKDQIRKCSTPAALSIAQIPRHNNVNRLMSKLFLRGCTVIAELFHREFEIQCNVPK